MKKITILGILALVMMPLFSDAMEQKRKPAFQKGDGKVTKKRKVDEDSAVQDACGWDDCPAEIKMHILYFVIDANGAMNAIAAKDKKAIFKFIKQWRSLLSVNKEFNSFALDKQLFNIKQVSGTMLEKYPGCLVRLVKRSLKSKCDYFFKLPQFIVITSFKQGVLDLLAIASCNGYEKFCHKLIDFGIAARVAENIPLIHAIYLHNHSAVKKLIECGEGTALLKNGRNQLMIASEVGDSAIVKMLLDARPDDLNVKTNLGITPLILAVRTGCKEVVKSLLEQGAEINHEASGGLTPLILACLNGHSEIVELLLKQGAVIDKTGNNNFIPIVKIALKRYEEVVELLLKEGVSLNQKDSRGYTALMVASWKGRTKIVKFLLAKGASVNVCDKDNEATALIFAAASGHKDVVKLLLASHADINQKSECGYTALMFAARAGRLEVVQLLLNQGAEVHNKSKSGETALLLATESENEKIVNLLKAFGAK